MSCKLYNGKKYSEDQFRTLVETDLLPSESKFFQLKSPAQAKNEIFARYGKKFGNNKTILDPHMVVQAKNAASAYNKQMGRQAIAIYQSPDGHWRMRVNKESFSSILSDNKKTRDKELEQKIISNFLSPLGINVKTYEEAKAAYEAQGKPLTGIGLADLMNRLILINEGAADITTLPEEAAHFAIAMLKDHPYVQNAMNKISETKLWEERSAEYMKLYDQNEQKVREELVGQMLAEVIIKKNTELAKPAIVRLFNKIAKAFVDAFNKLVGRQKDLQQEMRNQLGEFANDILLGNTERFDLSKLSNESFSQINLKEVGGQPILKKHEKLVDKVLEAMKKKAGIHKNSGHVAYLNKVQKQTKDIKRETVATRALIKFINIADAESLAIMNRLSNLKENPELRTPTDVAKALKQMNLFLHSYAEILKEIKADLVEHPLEDKKIHDDIMTALRNVTERADVLNRNYNEIGAQIVAETLWPFMKDNPEIEDVDQVIEMLKVANNDIGFKNQFLDSMAESTDDILGAIDRFVKEYKENARFEAEDIRKDLTNAAEKLKLNGISDTKWMYETHDSKVTGYIVSEVNWGAFYAAREEYKKAQLALLKVTDIKKMDTVQRRTMKKRMASWDLENTEARPDFKEYTDNMYKRYEKMFVTEPEKGNQEVRKRQEAELKKAWSQFMNNNTRRINGKVIYTRQLARPNSERFGNPKYKEIMDNPVKASYYKTIMDVKEKTDRSLPTTVITGGPLAPQIHKDSFERGLLNPDTYRKLAQDTFVRRKDDIEFGEPGDQMELLTEKYTDERGRPVERLPIFYVHRLDDLTDLTQDMTAAMNEYAAMGTNYKHMNQILDVLEVGKDLVENRTVLSSKLIDKVTGRKPAEPMSGGRAYDRLEKYYQMVVYGRMKKDEGSFELFGQKIDKAKAIDALGRWTSIQGLAFNLYSGVSNVAFGNSLMLQEAVAGGYFTKEEYAKAYAAYGKETPGVLADIGKLTSTSKLRLVLEYFDVLQDFDARTRSVDADRSRAGRTFFDQSVLYFFNHAGEHQMQGTLAIAMMLNKKITVNGKEVTLWDALEVDEQTNKLILPKELSSRERNDFTIRMKAANQRLHGIYNEIDRSALQHYALGRLALMFRKWMVPGFNRRWGKKAFNYSLQDQVEGSYRTLVRIFNRARKEANWGLLVLNSEKDTLSTMELENMRRAYAEIIQFGLMTLTIALLGSMRGDDDDYVLDFVAYEALRVRAETSFYFNPNEWIRLVQSPSAAVHTISDYFNFMGTLLQIPYDLATTGEISRYKSGRNKDEIKAIAKGKDVFIPFYRTIDGLSSPDEKLKFFK